AFAAATFDPGVRISDTVVVQIVNEPTRTAVVRAVTDEPSVVAVAAASPDAPRAAVAASSGAEAAGGDQFVSPPFFGVLDIAVVRGRAFTPVERSPSLSVAVVSETTARTLWPTADAVGQVIRLDADRASETQREGEPRIDSRTFTVVGVVRDVPGF